MVENPQYQAWEAGRVSISPMGGTGCVTLEKLLKLSVLQLLFYEIKVTRAPVWTGLL